jgi:hypothetical protein
MAKASPSIISSIFENLNVLLVESRTKKELTACLVPSSAIEQVHWLRVQWSIAITRKRRLLSGFHVHYTSSWHGWKQSLIRRNKVTHSYYCDYHRSCSQATHLSTFFPSWISAASRINSTRWGAFVWWNFRTKVGNTWLTRIIVKSVYARSYTYVCMPVCRSLTEIFYSLAGT